MISYKIEGMLASYAIINISAQYYKLLLPQKQTLTQYKTGRAI